MPSAVYRNYDRNCHPHSFAFVMQVSYGAFYDETTLQLCVTRQNKSDVAIQRLPYLTDQDVSSWDPVCASLYQHLGNMDHHSHYSTLVSEPGTLYEQHRGTLSQLSLVKGGMP